MKLLFCFLFFAFYGYSQSFRKLSKKENAALQSVCGTKGYHLHHPRSIWSRVGVPSSGVEAPWAVRVVFDPLGGCSGVLISSRHVLTASHCFMKSETDKHPWIHAHSVRRCENKDMIFTQNHDQFHVLGSNWDKNKRVLSDHIVKVVLFNFCENTDWTYDDLMLLEFRDDVKFYDDQHPACIPNHRRFESPRQTAFVAGFGHTNFSMNGTGGKGKLHMAIMTIEGPVRNERFFITTNKTAKYQGKARGGDSGAGALAVAIHNWRYYVTGIVSSGTELQTTLVSVGYHYKQICKYTGICDLKD